MRAQSLSCVPFAIPWTNLPHSSVPGKNTGVGLEWVAVSFSRGSS